MTIISLDQKPAQTNLEFINILTHLLGSSALSFLTHAQALTPIQVFRNFTNTRLNLGSLKKWPQGLLVVGDAACILNPVYGQGMTVAAQQIALLQQSLASPKKMLHWEHQFQRDIDASTNFPWLMATTEDLRAHNKSQLSYSTRFFQRYIDHILQRATTDQELHHSFLRVMHMLDPPYYLLKPRIFLPQQLSAKLTL